MPQSTLFADDEARSLSLEHLILPALGKSDGAAHELVPELLRAVRQHLGMEAAFVAEFIGGQRVFRYVDDTRDVETLDVGASDPLEQSYCQRVVDGRLPRLIRDAQRVPAALELAATSRIPIGAHLSVPIRREDGSVYGTFCCFSRVPDQSLTERDLGLMRVFADVAGALLSRELDVSRAHAVRRARVERALGEGAMTIVYQPIFELASERVAGFESLTRFSLAPVRGPDAWFEDAAEVGLSEELETRSIARALALDHFAVDQYVAVNVSPSLVRSPGSRLFPLLQSAPLSRVVLELTEHASIDDYGEIMRALAPLRAAGLRLSVDDAGAGYASFRHILALAPDFIKLDMSLTRDIDRDAGRRALAAALIGFARETGAELIAEGVETEAELRALAALGVEKAQGYLLGRPVALSHVQTIRPRSLPPPQ